MSQITYKVLKHDGGWAYEDEKGRWHDEIDSGTDRPSTTVKG